VARDSGHRADRCRVSGVRAGTLAVANPPAADARPPAPRLGDRHGRAAFVVWLLAIAPGAVDTLAAGGDTLAAFKNGFIQALVLGPLIGLSQATALRGDTTRWKWWFAANVTTWLFGAATYEFGKWLLDELSLPKGITPAFPILAFFIHGTWMLWVTAPDATAHVPPPPERRKRQRPARPPAST
jgi:hypothetical protein